MLQTFIKTTRHAVLNRVRGWSACVPVLILAVFAGTTQPAAAQGGSLVGLGGQIGTPAGITLKLRNPTAISVDFMAAWDSEDFFFLNVHGLFEKHVGEHQNVHVFYGPGAYVGSRDIGPRRNPEHETVVGMSATVGLGYLLEQFELFGQVTPRFDLTPATDSELGIGAGVRYYF